MSENLNLIWVNYFKKSVSCFKFRKYTATNASQCGASQSVSDKKRGVAKSVLESHYYYFSILKNCWYPECIISYQLYLIWANYFQPSVASKYLIKKINSINTLLSVNKNFHKIYWFSYVKLDKHTIILSLIDQYLKFKEKYSMENNILISI